MPRTTRQGRTPDRDLVKRLKRESVGSEPGSSGSRTIAFKWEASSMPRKKASKETTIAFEKAAVRRLPRRTKAQGQIVWPAVPALLDHYQRCLANIFSSLGRTFSTEEIELLRQNLKKHLEPAFKASPHSKIRIEYQTDPLPSTAITYTVSHNVFTIADEYDGWVQNRPPPLFGVSPDAKVMQVARSIGESASVR